MATILLLDANEVAGRAMQGILARGSHRCVVATNGNDAWTCMHKFVSVDLIFVELELAGENGLTFIQRLRGNSLLNKVPIVVYTGVSDHAMVKKVLAFRVQNYLIKPYVDEYIFREIAKAVANPWRNLHFEEERSFCAQMGIFPDQLQKMRVELMETLERSQTFFTASAESPNVSLIVSRIDTIIDRAEAAGVWAVADCMKDLRAKAEQKDWGSFKRCDEDIDYARRLIKDHIKPGEADEGVMTDEERREKEEAAARALWLNRDVDKDGPMASAADVQGQVEGLPACPVIDTVGAAFQMTAEKRATNLNQLMDLVGKDPGLCAAVLAAANHLEHDDMTTIDDARTAISLLGNVRMMSLAKILPPVPPRHMEVPPISWPQFWMFQVGVGKLAEFACKAFEFELLVPTAYTAGLLHDVGKLILLRLFPHSLPAMVNYARDRGVLLHVAERKFLDSDSREMGYWYAKKNLLPPAYCSVIRWVEAPDQATQDQEIVAVVSLARHLCIHNHVGNAGDVGKGECPPIEQTAAWQVLRTRIFPSFNLKRFEAQAHALCLELRQTLAGKQSAYAA